MKLLFPSKLNKLFEKTEGWMDGYICKLSGDN